MNTDSQPPFARPGPEVNEVTFEVGDVKFSLDVSYADERSQRYYQMLGERGIPLEPVMTRCLTRLIREMKETQFLDIGAYVGYYACYVSALLNDSKPVHAIESNPVFCQGLRRSCELNGFTQLKVHNAVLSDRRESVIANDKQVLFGDTPDQALTSITLEELRIQESMKPNIIKMDVHGTEGKVLYGMGEMLTDSVDYLLLELHPPQYLRKFTPGITRSKILQFLDDRGLYTFYVAGQALPREFKTRIRTDGFTYRRLIRDTSDLLFFDRHSVVFLLVSRHENVEEVLGPSVDDHLLCLGE